MRSSPACGHNKNRRCLRILVSLVWLCLSAMQRVQPQFRQVHARARHRPFQTSRARAFQPRRRAETASWAWRRWKSCVWCLQTPLAHRKGSGAPPSNLSLPFLRPPIPCWLGGCSSRVAYSKITAARIFLYSAPIGTCRCASSPIGPNIRPQNRGCAPACALTSSFWHQLPSRPAVGRISLAQCTGTLPMLWDNTPGSLGCPPVPTQDGALSRWSPALSKRSVLMRRGTLKGPIPIKMSLCLLQLSASSSGALHTPRSLLQPSTASITAGTLLGRLTCPLPTLKLLHLRTS